MKFTDLSEHLHELRATRTNNAMVKGRMMSAMDIWQGALDSDRNNVKDIRVLIDTLPPGFEGIFLRYSQKNEEKVIIATGIGLSHPRQRFVIAKELMHCWSPKDSYVGDPKIASDLALALTYKTTIDASMLKIVQADRAAITAAAEVILPHYVIEKEIREGISLEETASRHNLDMEIAREICPHYTLAARKNGYL
ncbi:hypothetical protein [Acetobacter persici]|uniref:hypothetical protein n=1 Tax=Acetobacter persici TaxID=1076596 RepID=UPI0039EBE7B5